MRLLVNLLFLAGFVAAFGGTGHWLYHRFVTGGALIQAAAKGDIDAAKRALARGANIDADSLEGYNAMRAAIKGGHLPMVRFLLDQGADPNQKTMDAPPLAWAASYGRRDIYDFLHARGARLRLTPFGYEQLTQQMKNWGSRDMIPDIERQYKLEAAEPKATRRKNG